MYSIAITLLLPFASAMPLHAHGCAYQTSYNPASASTTLRSSSKLYFNVDAQNEDDYSIIRKGGLYIEHNFINKDQIAALQRDIALLRSNSSDTLSINDDHPLFQPSGLSNRIPGDKNIFGSSDRLTCTITPNLGGDRHIRSVVEDKLKALKIKLQDVLPGLDNSNKLELAEMYYSASPPQSHLPRHMDERHEDTKGDKGWMNDTRRSISWLLYLNDHNWGMRSDRYQTTHSDCADDANAFTDDSLSDAELEALMSGSGDGGELRAYCRMCCRGLQCGSNEGNVQVGWLHSYAKSHSSASVPGDKNDGEEFEPIFLDSWVKAPAEECIYNHQGYDDEDEEIDVDMYPSQNLSWCTLSALYRIRRTSVGQATKIDSESDSLEKYFDDDLLLRQEEQYPQREYLSVAFGPKSPTWPSDTSLDPVDFANALASQLHTSLRNRFVSTEAIHDQPVDVLPTGGTLILFDSVAVPHEVLPTTRGERLAIAGWFHEAQQPCPDWYGT
jgi:hypothetical protein